MLHLALQARAMSGRSRRRQHEAPGDDARGLSAHFARPSCSTTSRSRCHAQSTPSVAIAASWSAVSFSRLARVLEIHTPSLTTTGSASQSTMISSL